MRLLGSLFLLFLVLVAVGYVQGWFAINTSHAGGKQGVAITVDDDKIADDAASVKHTLGIGKAEQGGSAETSASDVEGTITLVDLAGRDLTVTVATETIVQHVPTSVAVTRGGAAVPFEQLRANMRARFSFEKTGASRHLVRVELLP
ncbi:MAG TPA: hypothetical protein VFZ65_00595 [Planctomycetota bacterium]|nr:hypothetical protein [Planctomycetota bacterium]